MMTTVEFPRKALPMTTTTVPAEAAELLGAQVEATGQLIGYARVSTAHQDYEGQIETLKAHGVHDGLLYTDKRSGKNAERPGLREALEVAQPGDTLVVAKLDRLGRNTADMIRIVTELTEKGVGFRALDHAHLDTTSPSGKLMFTMFSAIAEYERELILERTTTGRRRAEELGRKGGRRKLTEDEDKLAKVRRAHELHDKGMTVKEIAAALKVGLSTAYRWLDTPMS